MSLSKCLKKSATPRLKELAFVVLMFSGATVMAQSQVISRVAGTTVQGYSGDGGPAISARIAPEGLAVDHHGNVYLSEPTNHAIRRIDHRTGIITTYAGTGASGYNGEGLIATATNLNYPFGVAVDSDDNLYIIDDLPARIRRVDRRTSRVTTVAGTGINGFSGDGGPATSAQINATSIAFDRNDNLYIGDSGNDRIRRVDHQSGIITTLVGSGLGGVSPSSGAASAAEFLYYISLAIGPYGTFYFADDGLNTVRRFDGRNNTFTTVAGVYYGPQVTGQATYNGDGIPATQAYLNFPSYIAIDCANDLFISDTFNYRIREVDLRTGLIETVAGTGAQGYGGDGGLANQAMLDGPRGLGFAPDGSLYVADGFTVRRIAGFTGTRGWDCRDERRFHGGDEQTWRHD